MIQMEHQEKFWAWFAAHQTELHDSEIIREGLLDELAAQLQKIDPNLAFEIGPKGRRREFVISAGGIRSAFSAVISVKNAAPAFEQWQIIAFRPRRSPLCAIEFRGKRVKPTDVQFTLLDNGSIAGIYLFIPGYREGDADLKQIGYLLLDNALGEFDVESQLGLIKIFPTEAPMKETRYSLPELPVLFDQLTSQLKGNLGKPS